MTKPGCRKMFAFLFTAGMIFAIATMAIFLTKADATAIVQSALFYLFVNTLAFLNLNALSKFIKSKWYQPGLGGNGDA